MCKFTHNKMSLSNMCSITHGNGKVTKSSISLVLDTIIYNIKKV